MSATSPSVPILSAAIQFYIHQGSSVPVLECIDLALKTFRYEVVSYQDTLKAGILSAGVLLCKLNASPEKLRPNLRPIKCLQDEEPNTIVYVVSPSSALYAIHSYDIGSLQLEHSNELFGFATERCCTTRP